MKEPRMLAIIFCEARNHNLWNVSDYDSRKMVKYTFWNHSPYNLHMFANLNFQNSCNYNFQNINNNVSNALNCSQQIPSMLAIITSEMLTNKISSNIRNLNSDHNRS